jgi:transcriptional regulator with XRE-family HTH domain
LDLSQSQLGEQLGKLLGRSWSRQAVSNAEQGRREFTVDELTALAWTLQTTVPDLVLQVPQMASAVVDLPGPHTFLWHQLLEVWQSDPSQRLSGKVADLARASLDFQKDAIERMQNELEEVEHRRKVADDLIRAAMDADKLIEEESTS